MSKNEDVKSLIAYCRQSGARAGETRESSLSLEQQQEALKEWADRNGYTVDAYIRDHDESGRSLNRPGILELKERVRPGVTVAVWKYDRFARNLIGAELAVESLRELGATVISTTEPQGKLSRQIMGSIAEYYSDQLSERLVAIREQQARRGQFTGGQPPYGYMRRDGTMSISKYGVAIERRSGPLVPHPDESLIVQEVHRRYLAGDSMYAISVDLVARGIPRSMGGTWNTTLIRKMLTNPFYAGFATHKGEAVAKGLHEPLVDPAQWEAIQQRVARHQIIKNDSPNKETSWLEGLIYHACGNRMYLSMVGGSAARYPNFICRRAQGPYRCNVPSISIAQKKLETMVRARLIADFENVAPVAIAMERAESKAGGHDAAARRRALDERLKVVERRHTKARAMYLDGDDPKDVWEIEKKRYDDDLVAIEFARSTLPVAPDPDRYAVAAEQLEDLAPTIPLVSDNGLKRILELVGRAIFSESDVAIQYDQPYADFLQVAR